MSFNQAIISGNVGQDPEIRTFDSGKSKATFSVACTEKWLDKESNDWKEKTEWVNIEAWGKQADRVGNRVRKGDSVFVTGKLRTDSFERKDGSKGTKTFLACSTLEIYPKSTIDRASHTSDSAGSNPTTNGASEPSF